MANVTHSAITDAFKHEPKGADTAARGEVYLANGAGSGSWTKIYELVASNNSRSGTTNQFEIDDNLSAYRCLWLSIHDMDIDSDSENMLLEIESGGSYKTSGYEGCALGLSTHATETSGFLLVPIRSGVDRFSGQYFLENTNKAGIVSFSGSTLSLTGNIGSLSTTAYNDLVFGRYNSNATVTGLRITGQIDRQGDVKLTLYGLRG